MHTLSGAPLAAGAACLLAFIVTGAAGKCERVSARAERWTRPLVIDFGPQ